MLRWRHSPDAPPAQHGARMQERNGGCTRRPTAAPLHCPMATACEPAAPVLPRGERTWRVHQTPPSQGHQALGGDNNNDDDAAARGENMQMAHAINFLTPPPACAPPSLPTQQPPAQLSPDTAASCRRWCHWAPQRLWAIRGWRTDTAAGRGNIAPLLYRPAAWAAGALDILHATPCGGPSSHSCTTWCTQRLAAHDAAGSSRPQRGGTLPGHPCIAVHLRHPLAFTTCSTPQARASWPEKPARSDTPAARLARALLRIKLGVASGRC
jgi:hypothetical protein